MTIAFNHNDPFLHDRDDPCGHYVILALPRPELPSVPGNDKAHHFIVYALLMLPVVLRKPTHLLWVAMFFIVYGGVIERIQPYVNRYGDWLDLLANGIGVACGMLAGGGC